jgi:hypothetical protein
LGEQTGTTPEGLAFLAVEQPFYSPWRASTGETMTPAQEEAKAFRDDLETILRSLRDVYTWDGKVPRLSLFALLAPIPVAIRSHEILEALDRHIELLNRDLPPVTHARAAVTAAKRSVEVPSDFPARLETAKGRNSWSWVAKELKRDPKTVMKLRTPGAFIDGPVYEAALEWVNGRETAKRSLSGMK